MDERQDGWAKPVRELYAGELPAQAVNLVDGKRVTNPLQGFGQLWRKTYRIRMKEAVEPQAIIAEWRAHFPEFWPQGNHFYGPHSIQPGGVAVLNLAGPGGRTLPGGAPLIATGVLVIYADDESFAFMTPQGHMFTGMITFSAGREETASSAEETVCQVEALIRASDPLYELGFRLGVMHPTEDAFWFGTLRNLAGRFGGFAAEPTLDVRLEDQRVQWRQAGNVWHNSAVRTGFYYAGRPVRWARRTAASVFRRTGFLRRSDVSERQL